MTRCVQGLGGLLAALAICVAGCSDDDKAPFAKLSWHVNCAGFCSENITHTIQSLDGEDGFKVECTTRTTSSGSKRVDFSAQSGNADTRDGFYRLKVERMELLDGSLLPGAECHVEASESTRDFGGDQGRCTVSAPTSETPCQFSDVTLSGDKVTGKLYCSGLCWQDDQSVCASLSDGQTGGPLSFEFDNCDKL